MAKTQSTFPTTIDNTLQVDRAAGDTITSESYDIIEDALFELETKVGVDTSAVATTLDYKLTNAASIDPGHLHTSTSASGAGGTVTRRLIFPASCFETRAGTVGWAGFTQVQGTNLDYATLDFDTAADEIVISPPFFMEDYNGGNITITIGWKATATSGTVMWNAAFCGITDDEPWDAALSNHAFATDTPGGTAEDMVITTLIVDPAELAANDATVMKIWRDVSEDNMAGDAKLLWVQLEYTEA